MEIETFVAGRMSESEFVAACGLHHAAFGDRGRTLAAVIEKKRAVWMGSDVVPGPLVSEEPPRRYAVRVTSSDGSDGGRWLGNAAVLVRTIGTATGDQRVLGLMDVATRPETRGQGLGQRLVRAAWSAVDDGRYPVCLLKTRDARGFYEKLGARVIDNKLIDSTVPGNDHHPAPPHGPDGHNRQYPHAFGESFAMIYPANADWPDGEIDLRGPAF